MIATIRQPGGIGNRKRSCIEMSVGAVGRDGLLARAVPCNWPSCGNVTRDSSMYCIHHQRSTQHGRGAEMYRDGSTILDRVRASALSGAVSRQPDRAWVDTARSLSGDIMDRSPVTTVRGDSWIITHATDLEGEDSRAVVWDGRQVVVPADGSELETPDGAALSLHGDELRVRCPDGPGADPRVTMNVASCGAVRWGQMCQRAGVLSGYGENYDDRAEIMAQFSVTDDPNLSVSYSMMGDGNVKMTVAESTPAGRAVEAYEIIPDNWEVRGGRLGRYTKVGVPTHRSRRGASGRPVIEEMDPSTLEARADMVEDVMLTSDLISRYSVRVRGKLYLPTGWSDRER